MLWQTIFAAARLSQQPCGHVAPERPRWPKVDYCAAPKGSANETTSDP